MQTRIIVTILALATIAALAAPGVTAQAAEDGCLQGNPCVLEVLVDETGIVDVSVENFTKGDWWQVTLSNDDLDAAHTVTVAGFGITLQAAAFDDATSNAVHLTTTGDFTINESPKGTTHTIHILDADAVAHEQGQVDADGNPITSRTPGGSSRMPGVPLGLFVAGLAIIVLALRRKA